MLHPASDFHGGMGVVVVVVGGTRRREVDSRAPALIPYPPHPKAGLLLDLCYILDLCDFA